MKNLGSDEVYYGVAALTVIILLVYIHAGEVIPLVGFLLSGSLVYALYPNKSVALVAGVVIASMLQMTKREGFEDDDAATSATAATAATSTTTAAQSQNVGTPSPSTQPSGADTAGEVQVQMVSAEAGALTVDSGNPPAPPTVTPSPAEVASNQATAESQRRQRQAARRQAKRAAQAAQAAPGPPGTEGLSNLNPSDMTSTEMDQLSTLIDKTTDLLKMLPDGFLAKASI